MKNIFNFMIYTLLISCSVVGFPTAEHVIDNEHIVDTGAGKSLTERDLSPKIVSTLHETEGSLNSTQNNPTDQTIQAQPTGTINSIQDSINVMVDTTTLPEITGTEKAVLKIDSNQTAPQLFSFDEMLKSSTQKTYSDTYTDEITTPIQDFSPSADIIEQAKNITNLQVVGEFINQMINNILGIFATDPAHADEIENLKNEAEKSASWLSAWDEFSFKIWYENSMKKFNEWKNSLSTESLKMKENVHNALYEYYDFLPPSHISHSNGSLNFFQN